MFHSLREVEAFGTKNGWLAAEWGDCYLVGIAAAVAAISVVIIVVDEKVRYCNK